MKNRILFICDFSSPHSRSLIEYYSEQKELAITVISTFYAENMSGVHLILANKSKRGSKSSIIIHIANLVQKFSNKIYRKISVLQRKRTSKKLTSAINQINLEQPPKVIHILRTQPEGIASIDFLKKHDCKKYLTTWGQDFVLWADNDKWIRVQTDLLLQQLDKVFPDNPRDKRIIVEDYGYPNIESIVMPATGGIQLRHLNQFDRDPIKDVKGQISLFTNRGYPGSFVKLKELLKAYKIITKIYPDSHFYIDLKSQVYIERDRPIEGWIDELGLKEKVTLLHLTREETFKYLRSCDYYVSATTSDGLPMSLLEALYFGIIPIIFNHESTKNLLDEFTKFYAFDSLKPNEIANAIQHAIQNNKGDRKQNITSNREVIRSKYAQIKNLSETLKYYTF